MSDNVCDYSKDEYQLVIIPPDNEPASQAQYNKRCMSR